MLIIKIPTAISKIESCIKALMRKPTNKQVETPISKRTYLNEYLCKVHYCIKDFIDKEDKDYVIL